MDDEETLRSLQNFFEKLGMEVYLFKVGWYNESVGKQFKLNYHPDTAAFVVISTPSMFEKAFLPYIKNQNGGYTSNKTNNALVKDTLSSEHALWGKDPLDACLDYNFHIAKSFFNDENIEIIHDFEILPNKRPKILVQTAAHVAGAAYYYQKSDVVDMHDENCPLSTPNTSLTGSTQAISESTPLDSAQHQKMDSDSCPKTNVETLSKDQNTNNQPSHLERPLSNPEQLPNPDGPSYSEQPSNSESLLNPQRPSALVEQPSNSATNRIVGDSIQTLQIHNSESTTNKREFECCNDDMTNTNDLGTGDVRSSKGQSLSQSLKHEVTCGLSLIDESSTTNQNFQQPIERERKSNGITSQNTRKSDPTASSGQTKNENYRILREEVAQKTNVCVIDRSRHPSEICIRKRAWDPSRRIYGVCVHPKYGGWFAIRGVMIFPDLQTKIQQRPPVDCCNTRSLRIELLNRFNGNWQDWSYRNVVPVVEKYSELQKKYFATLPKNRHLLFKELLQAT